MKAPAWSTALLSCASLLFCACDSPPEIKTAVRIDSGESDVYASQASTGWVEIRLTRSRAYKALNFDTSIEERKQAFADLIKRAGLENEPTVEGLEIRASYPEFDTDAPGVDPRQPTFILVAKVINHPATGVLFWTKAGQAPEIQWNEHAKSAVDVANKSYYAAVQNDPIRLRLESGDTANVFSRSGQWRASLCAMSDDSSIAGYRAGTAGFQVWEKRKRAWQRSEFVANTSGVALVPGKLRCADATVTRGGTFYLAVNHPPGSNYVVHITGGGPALKMSTIR